MPRIPECCRWAAAAQSGPHNHRHRNSLDIAAKNHRRRNNLDTANKNKEKDAAQKKIWKLFRSSNAGISSEKEHNLAHVISVQQTLGKEKKAYPNGLVWKSAHYYNTKQADALGGLCFPLVLV